MITFDIFTLRLSLFDHKKEPISNVLVRVQFYDSQHDQWVTVYTKEVVDGVLDFRGIYPGATEEETIFFSMIRYDKMPLVRIIPDKAKPGLTKQMIISSTYSFGSPSPGTFEMNFGTLYGIPVDTITDEISPFADILPVTSFFPPGSSETPTIPVPINSLYSNIVSEIATATELSADSPFKLSNISLKLKAMIHQDGETMSASLLDASNSENINGNAISELVFDITPNQGSVSSEQIMPNLIGLTETATRKVLHQYGLKLNPVYQQNLDVVNGDSFKQSPEARGRMPQDKIVTVIFSKNEQS